MSCSTSSSSTGNCVCISLVKGVDHTFILSVQADGAPVDVSGWEVYMDVKEKVTSDVLFSLSTASGITLSDPTAGEITVSVSSLLTDGLTQSKGVFDVLGVDTLLNSVVILPLSKLIFKDKVTSIP